MNQIITDIITKFESDLTAALKEHALESVTGLLSGVTLEPDVTKTNGMAKPITSARGARKAKGGKRTAEQLEALTKSLLAAIKKAPGSSIEAVAKSMNVTTKELALPVLKLHEAKAIRTKGQKRATKYFAK